MNECVVVATVALVSRQHVFHLTFPQHWNADDIHQLFAPYSTSLTHRHSQWNHHQCHNDFILFSVVQLWYGVVCTQAVYRSMAWCGMYAGSVQIYGMVWYVRRQCTDRVVWYVCRQCTDLWYGVVCTQAVYRSCGLMTRRHLLHFMIGRSLTSVCLH